MNLRTVSVNIPAVSVFTNRSSHSSEQARSYTAAILDLLGDQQPFAVLRDTPSNVRRVVAGLDDDKLSQPEAAGKWSMRHVVRHLADSEIVWGYRLRLVLAQHRP